MNVVTTLHHVYNNVFSGVHSLSLSSSPPSEDGHVRVCSGTTVTLTCTASQIEVLAWRQDQDDIHPFFPDDYETEENRVVL